MESFDSWVKCLVQEKPGDFIAFGLGLPQVEVIRPESTALPSRARAVDDIYRIRVGDRLFISHLEYHRRHQAKDELAFDVAEAQVRIFRREKTPVLSQVWDLYGDAKAPLLKDHTIEFGPGCQSTYRRVNLRALSWQQLFREAPPSLWPLLPLTRDGAAPEPMKQVTAAILARQDISSPVQADHLAVLRFVAEAEGLPIQLLLELIPRNKMIESQFYQSILQEGEAIRQAKALLRLLLRRFDYVDESLSARVLAETRMPLLESWFDDAAILADEDALRSLVTRIKSIPQPPAS